MVNNEHNDAINYTLVDSVSSDEENDTQPGYFYNNQLSYEDWCDWHSEHLLNMWMNIREYNSINYNPLLLNCTYPDFCKWSYNFSSKLP